MLIVYTVGCDPGWIEHNASCYLIVAKTSQSAVLYSDAQQLCKAGGGDLVTIANHYEQAFIMSQLPPFAGIVWIGLSVTGQSNYVWSDNEPFSYSFLAPTTYSDAVSGSSDHCIGMNPMGSENAGMWRLISCKSRFGYVCKKAMSA